jgi:hypothetical protein
MTCFRPSLSCEIILFGAWQIPIIFNCHTMSFSNLDRPFILSTSPCLVIQQFNNIDVDLENLIYVTYPVWPLHVWTGVDLDMVTILLCRADTAEQELVYRGPREFNYFRVWTTTVLHISFDFSCGITHDLF